MHDRETCEGKSIREEEQNSMEALSIVLFVVVLAAAVVSLCL